VPLKPTGIFCFLRVPFLWHCGKIFNKIVFLTRRRFGYQSKPGFVLVGGFAMGVSKTVFCEKCLFEAAGVTRVLNMSREQLYSK